MDEAELAAQLAVLLGEELADRIPDLNKVLLALERAPSDGELLRELHRLIHVVKGASRSAGMLEIEAACHALETLLADVGPGMAAPASLIASGIAFIDQLERARQGLVAKPGPDERDASLRVAADDLDLMMTHSAAVLLARQRLMDPVHALSELQGELSARRSITATELASTSRRLGRVQRELASALAALGTTSGLLDENVRRIRLRSIGDACQGCDRIVRDTAASVGKQAELVVRGGEVRVDRAQLDVLRDALIQLVRNSVAHGIEAPEVRVRAGKPELGQVTIAADVVGDCVRVTVADDGGGLDVEAVATQAAKHGVRVETLADAERAIFSPGLSTAATVSQLAGRG
ncbi:MAG: Hpt domain-containing protein, partial [Kofleriaceae bacterium]